MKRKIIEIDDNLCNGCGECIPNCPEGALQIIDGKARMVSELSCDGLGACIGHCPLGAIRVVEREAEAYDELKVIQNIVRAGEGTLIAHLAHLHEHDQAEYLQQALDYLEKQHIPVPSYKESKCHGGCPGGMMIDRTNMKQNEPVTPASPQPSELRQWPVQLKLLNPEAPYFNNCDLLITADCVPFAMADYHQKYLKDKVVAIFCPKLDADLQSYIDKLTAIFEKQSIRSVTVLRMEVPCCGGTTAIVQQALDAAGKTIPLEEHIVSLQGETL